MADVQDAALKLVDGLHDFIVTEVEVQLCIISISVKRHAILGNLVCKIGHVQNEEQQTMD